MNELRVLFTAESKGYRIRFADTDGNNLGVEVPFIPFLTEENYEDLRWYLEEYMDLPDGGAVVRARRVEALSFVRSLLQAHGVYSKSISVGF